MTIKEIIEKGIEGGWKPEATPSNDLYTLSFHVEYDGVRVDQHNEISSEELVFIRTEPILLDPSFWQAVGKVERWKCDRNCPIEEGSYCDAHKPRWQYNMHRMIDALAEGKSLEEYIATL